jgi:hypothetical protein
MTIEELIEELESLSWSYGDVPVKIKLHTYDRTYFDVLLAVEQLQQIGDGNDLEPSDEQTRKTRHIVLVPTE